MNGMHCQNSKEWKKSSVLVGIESGASRFRGETLAMD